MEHQRGNRRHPDQFSETRRMAKSGGKSTTTKWFDVTVLEKESTLPTRWLLLEEEKGRKDYTGGSHETEGPGSRVHLRLLRALGYPSDVSSPVLLATAESRRCSRPLSERSLSGRRCEAGGPATLSCAAARQEGMDARRARVSIKAHVPRRR